MSLQSETVQLSAADQRRSRGIFGWFMRRVAASEYGRLLVELPSGTRYVHCGAMPGPDAHLKIHSWHAVRRLVVGGDIGFAESYRRGEWSTHDLVVFFAWVTANEASLTLAWTGTLLPRMFHRIRHARRENTRTGSRRNISAHYDLGNDFYSAWLDTGMQYSSALFTHDTSTLEAAQTDKLARVMSHLAVAPGDRVIEIGCGWGAFAELAASTGCHVTGLTLSAQQLAYAERRVKTAGLDAKIDLQLTDYRDVGGRFDAVVSIEMLEAVGEQYWPTYFSKVHDLLRPDGTAVLQVITIAEDRFASYRDRPDFIQQYIFPGGMLPTKRLILEQAAEAGLEMKHVECFGMSYAATLAEWRRRFRAAVSELSALGYDERFRRVWDYYLAYCEAGFRNEALDVGLYVMTRPVSPPPQRIAHE